LLGQISFPGIEVADVWGYVDPTSGKEYALVGHGIFTDPPFAGLIIVDVTDPAAPNQVANVTTVPGFDVKVWQNYAYTVNGLSLGQGGIVDISNPEIPQVVGSFPSSHNIFIADNGYMYLEDPGLRIFDLNPDPTNPKLVWSSGDSDGHDAAVIGNRLYDFHGFSGTNIYDVSNPATPQLLGTVTDSLIAFHHSGWVSEDSQFLFICDELADIRGKPADFTVWDISDVTNPQKVGQFADSNGTVHNLYIIGNFAFVSYYTAGFRVFDVSDPALPALVDEFDTAPNSFGPGFDGAFGVYPFAPSGNIYVSDIEDGLFVFLFSGQPTEVRSETPETPSGFVLFDNYPNPFNPETTLSYQIPKSTPVKLVIYNILGKRIRTLVNTFQQSGLYKVTWDGKDNEQGDVPSGVYFYRIEAETFNATKRLILLR
jgi:choice-of-anchor B domain-containing protein